MPPIDLLEHIDKPGASDPKEKINCTDNENVNASNHEDNSSDDTEINSINQDTTPTPTPNESNSKAELKFTEFSMPKNLPPPNSLPLKNNLNLTCNKNILQQHSYTNQSVFTPSPISYPSLMYPSLPNTPQMSIYPQQLISFGNRNDAKVSNQPSTVYVHVDAGHIFQVQLGEKIRDIIGPATVKIVNNDNTQPVPLQLTTPAPGQIVQQIVDENGMLVHLIISSPQPGQLTPINGINRIDPINSQQVFNKTNFNNFSRLNAQKTYYNNKNCMASHYSKVPKSTAHFKNPYQSKINLSNNLHLLVIKF